MNQNNDQNTRIQTVQPVEETDVRTKTTGRIWGMATGMLGICIPLAPATHSGPMIPIFVLVAAATSTIAVWMKGGINISRPALQDNASQERISELEERLANLEAITNFEHKLLDKKYPGAAPVSTAPVASAFSFERPVQTPVSPPMPVDSGAEYGENGRAAARPIAS